MSESGTISAVIKENQQDILKEWLDLQVSASNSKGLIKESELRAQSANFLASFTAATGDGMDAKLAGTNWDEVRAFLATLSRNRALQGFSPTETATFVFSLKKPIINILRKTHGKDSGRLVDEIWNLTLALDALGLYTIEQYQKGREQVIQRQQQELLDLSTPVVQLWQGILALPLIGTLDSERTQTVMESLLEGIVEQEATIAIIDITGVPTVDTLVAQHLLKTVAAARLMGAECIISGIRPQIAQTIVHLGVELGDVVTKSTLAEALRVALRKRNLMITSAAGAKG
ncbi:MULTISPECIES: STAS domain-containing protein [unclassified Achromobacter]|uniref:STAS domain-containing protein n=1 Tax=unclassified Achromobacter TaxID=2626865 RepID=UPI000B517BE3|nr:MULTISPECIES: STAS domain-containing protein [unclassified Achromobacter]OWT71346.1 anti-anti-sigma factor [Achromobacter sp. HZ34]OWT73311.1 anti-anti-sigma factor [Achromobacter sp. HZ28]